MPKYKAHLIFGTFSFLVCVYLSFILIHFCPTILQIIGCFLCALLGSIFPDIDTTSKMQRIFFLFSSISLLSSIIFRFWFLFFNLSFVTLIVMLLKHRTLTHNIWFILVLSILLAFMSMFFGGFLGLDLALGSFSFLIGAISHILLDFLF